MVHTRGTDRRLPLPANCPEKRAIDLNGQRDFESGEADGGDWEAKLRGPKGVGEHALKAISN